MLNSQVLEDGSVVHINKTTISDTDDDGNRLDIDDEDKDTNRYYQDENKAWGVNMDNSDDDFNEFGTKIDDDNEDGNDNENIVVEICWKTFDV